MELSDKEIIKTNIGKEPESIVDSLDASEPDNEIPNIFKYRKKNTNVFN